MTTELGDAYEARLSHTPRARKTAGCYYTPPDFIDIAIDAALDPLLDACGPNLRVLDPACGDGRFLIAAGGRIAGRGGDPARCLFGVDRDPRAAALARAGLRRAFGTPGRVRVGDGLAVRGHYDLVIGNPPFVNAIEGGIGDATKADLRRRFPQVRGSADLAYYFLARAATLVRPGGRVALVLPRPALAAPALAEFRAGLPDHLRPLLIDAPESSRRFRGALVFVCLVVLGTGDVCRVRRGDAAAVGTLSSPNWWAATNALIDGPSPVPAGPRLGDVFDVSAGLTTGQAYALVPFVRERRAARRGRLVTTGLIDPDVLHWGRRLCRFLGRDYLHPAVSSAGLPDDLRRRFAKARRPKLIVAGLSRRVECVVDADGACLPSVGTFAAWHAQNDVVQLRRLADWLHSADAARLWRDELGANAVGGGDTVTTRAFLRGLSLPAGAW